MRHQRADYVTIQDIAQTRCGRLHMDLPVETSIEEDEPVFLLRAKDLLAPRVVRKWAALVRMFTGDEALAAAAEQWADVMQAWGRAHGSKLPDAPPDAPVVEIKRRRARARRSAALAPR